MCVYRMQSYRKTEMDTVPHRHRMANLAAPLGEVHAYIIRYKSFLLVC